MHRHSPFTILALIFILQFQSNLSAQTSWEMPSNSEIGELLAKRMSQNGVGIVVGITDNGAKRVVSYGETGANDERPLDGDSIFQIGSLTKTITTLLFANMIASGEINIDDLASDYLPDNISLPDISLQHLAMHTSGLPSMPGNIEISTDPNPVDGYLVSDLYEFLHSFEPASAPGTVWGYSNLGVSLLGRILANHAGMTYEELLTERILKPLEMHDTSIILSDSQLGRVMRGHDRYLSPIETWEMRTMPASGSLRSSVNDLLNFVEAYLDPREHSLSAAIDIQLSNRFRINRGEQALGWVILPGEIIQHSGGKTGYRSGIAINPNRGLGAVVLANARTDDLPINIALHLAAGMPLNDAPEAPDTKPRISLSQAELESFRGIYRFESGNEYEVGFTENLLLIRYPSGAILEFAATSPSKFFYTAGNDEIDFILDSNNDSLMILYPNGKEDAARFTANRISR